MSRRRYIYDPERKEMVEVGADWTDAPRSTGDLSKFEHDGMRTAEGVDISSRTKRREYMRATGLADPRDFRESAEKYRAAREARFTGAADRRERREAIGRILHNQRSGRGHSR